MTIDEAKGLIDEYVQTFNYTKNSNFKMAVVRKKDDK